VGTWEITEITVMQASACSICIQNSISLHDYRIVLRVVTDDQHCTSLLLLQKLDKLCSQFIGYCLDLANNSCFQTNVNYSSCVLLLNILLSGFLCRVTLLLLSQFLETVKGKKIYLFSCIICFL
jgi:hypothetical protein